MDINNEITTILEEAKAQILSNMAAKNINASGRTSRAFAVKRTEGGFALILGEGEKAYIDTGNPLIGVVETGRAPLATLETGRAPSTGNPPAPRGFYYIIKQWTKDKGISFGTESARGTFAYFLSKKIIREGTRRHQQNEDIYSTAAKTAAGKVQTLFTNFLRSSVTTALHTSIK